MAVDLDSSKVIHRMLEASYLLVNAEKITLFMIDQEKEELVAITRGERGAGSAAASSAHASAASGPNASPKSPQRFSINRGILGFCATSGKPVNVLDARKDWRFDPEVDSAPDLVTRSLLVVPVTDHMSKPIAIIQAVNKKAMTAPQVNPITGGSAAGIKSAGASSSHGGKDLQRDVAVHVSVCVLVLYLDVALQQLALQRLRQFGSSLAPCIIWIKHDGIAVCGKSK